MRRNPFYLLATIVSTAGNGGRDELDSLQHATGHQSLFNKQGLLPCRVLSSFTWLLRAPRAKWPVLNPIVSAWTAPAFIYPTGANSELKLRNSQFLIPNSQSVWWAWVDLNYRPHAYQACALTN
jgi:hypothetical protein